MLSMTKRNKVLLSGVRELNMLALYISHPYCKKQRHANFLSMSFDICWYTRRFVKGTICRRAEQGSTSHFKLKAHYRNVAAPLSEQSGIKRHKLQGWLVIKLTNYPFKMHLSWR